MVREGYLDRRKDNSSQEEVVEYVAGPRGKVEVGKNGVAGLVKAVYGFMGGGADPSRTRPAESDREVDAERVEQEEELNAKLRRSLGIENLDVAGLSAAGIQEVNDRNDEHQTSSPAPEPMQRRQGRPRRQVENGGERDDT